MSNSEQTTKAKQTAEKPKLTPEQREAQRKQALDDAAKKAVSSVTNLRAYLAVQSRFERYSTNNNLLIFAQRPDATRLKSLELWNKEKKWIREGAKAVAIYEPVRKQGKDGKTYTNFVRKNMSGGHDHRACLRHLFAVCVSSTVCQYRCLGNYAGLDLCRGNRIQYACACRDSEAVGSGCE